MKHPLLLISGITHRLSLPDDGLRLDESGTCRQFYTHDAVSQSECIDVRFVKQPASAFPVGEVLYEGTPWEGILMPYRWLVEKMNDRLAIRVLFDEHDTFHQAMALFDASFTSVEVWLDVKKDDVVVDPFFYPLGILMHIYLVHHRGGMVIHASGVRDGERGYLFTGVSGIGKSTMSRLWQEAGAQVVNDDRLVVMPAGGGFEIHNTPMPYYVDKPKSAALNAIFLLRQSPVNECRPITGVVSMSRVLANCMQHFHSRDYIDRYLDVVSAVVKSVPVFELGFKPDADVVALIRQMQW